MHPIVWYATVTNWSAHSKIHSKTQIPTKVDWPLINRSCIGTINYVTKVCVYLITDLIGYCLWWELRWWCSGGCWWRWWSRWWLNNNLFLYAKPKWFEQNGPDICELIDISAEVFSSFFFIIFSMSSGSFQVLVAVTGILIAMSTISLLDLDTGLRTKTTGTGDYRTPQHINFDSKWQNTRSSQATLKFFFVIYLNRFI